MTTKERKEFIEQLLETAKTFSEVTGQSLAESLLIIVNSLR